jgi:hypothetical protein
MAEKNLQAAKMTVIVFLYHLAHSENRVEELDVVQEVSATVL